MKKILSRILTLAVLFTLAAATSSCVHEWPEPLPTRGVSFTVHHELKWDQKEFNSGIGMQTREDVNDLAVRYIYRVYPQGNTTNPVIETTEYRTDLTLADFTTELQVPVGKYDVYVWTDFVKKDSDTGLYYDAKNFKAIRYTTPYKGDTMDKDAFAGMIEVDIPSSIDAVIDINYNITVKRPLTGFAFISSDLEEFTKGEIARRKLNRDGAESGLPAFDFTGYKVKLSYTGYLPCEYDMFRAKPVDSATGVSFEGEIRVLNDNEAVVGFDLFFINGLQSTIRVALDIYDPDGERIAGFPSLDVPVWLSTITLVKGNFLTTKASGGVGIDPGFDGEFNIKWN